MNTGFTFTQPTTTSGSGTGGFSFASPAFGSPSTGSTPAFGLTPSSSSENKTPNLFTSASNSTFSFGAQATRPSIFGQVASTAVSGATVTTSAAKSPFGFGIPVCSTSVTPGLGLTSATVASSTTGSPFSFGLQTSKPAVATQSVSGITNAAASTTASPFNLGLQTSKPFTFPSLTQTTTAVTNSTSSGAGSSTFGSQTFTTTSTLPQATTTAVASSPFAGTATFGAPLNFATSTVSGQITQSSFLSSSSPFKPSAAPTATFGFTTQTSVQNNPVIPSQSAAPPAISSTATTGQSSIFGVGATFPASVGIAKTTTSSLQTSTGSSPSKFSFGSSQPISSAVSTSIGSTPLFPSTLGTTSTSTTSTTALSIGTKATTSTTASTTTSTTTATGLTAISSATSTLLPASKPSTLTYGQLEELVNKWAHELEEQERYFLSEAERINQWDQTLINNGERIATLYEKVQACKDEQTKLEQELDFIEGQQRELDGLLEPLEKTANELPPGQLHSDFEREAIFQLAANVDLELGQLLSDLREMADQINSTSPLAEGISTDTDSKVMGKEGAKSRLPTQPQANASAVDQVTRILNCHMHSLNWIHQNTQELMERMKLLENA
ncbi:unnamed protein product [Calicophoron daubneyi]|uniref:Nucleoporin NSP1-like C-terminal domain-containing protein n=1 Tax=Calicophoron daubneyi TaxID=300641 RepID=A0AAV2TR09_CALDB